MRLTIGIAVEGVLWVAVGLLVWKGSGGVLGKWRVLLGERRCHGDVKVQSKITKGTCAGCHGPPAHRGVNGGTV